MTSLLLILSIVALQSQRAKTIRWCRVWWCEIRWRGSRIHKCSCVSFCIWCHHTVHMPMYVSISHPSTRRMLLCLLTWVILAIPDHVSLLYDATMIASQPQYRLIVVIEVGEYYKYLIHKCKFFALEYSKLTLRLWYLCIDIHICACILFLLVYLNSACWW